MYRDKIAAAPVPTYSSAVTWEREVLRMQPQIAHENVPEPVET
jgi:hypothetical protein